MIIDIIVPIISLGLVLAFIMNAEKIDLWFAIRHYNKRHEAKLDPKTPYKLFAYRKNDYMLENFCNKLEVKNNENEN